MPRLGGLATLSVGALALALALALSRISVAPAHAAIDRRTRLTWQDARAQVCVDVKADGTAT